MPFLRNSGSVAACNRKKRTVKLLNYLEKQLSPMSDNSFRRRSSDPSNNYVYGILMF
jgi:hypothetical protein